MCVCVLLLNAIFQLFLQIKSLTFCEQEEKTYLPGIWGFLNLLQNSFVVYQGKTESRNFFIQFPTQGLLHMNPDVLSFFFFRIILTSLESTWRVLPENDCMKICIYGKI